jgi:adenylate cyclase
MRRGARRASENDAVRVERHFAFVDLSGFTSFADVQGDDAAVDVLIGFREATRRVATEFGVRIAKWLGDGCMLVSVDASQLVASVIELDREYDDLGLPLAVHAGVAGGSVILLEGDDYTGRAVNLASRLADAAQPHEILCTPELAELAPPNSTCVPVGEMSVPGFARPVEVVAVRRAGDARAEPAATLA